MTTTVILIAGLIAGLLSRPWTGAAYKAAYRCQVAIGGLIGFSCGWDFHLEGDWGWALGVILLGELATFSLAHWFFRRNVDRPLLSYGTYRNIGWWATPLAAAFIGPNAALFAIMYDLVLSPRAMPGISLLRKHAPEEQGPKTAWIDYGAPFMVIVGLAAKTASGMPPQIVTSSTTYLAIASAGAAFCLLGASVPRTLPSRQHVTLASRSVAISFLVMPAVISVAVLCGLHMPAVSWLVAFAPGPFLLQSKAYGYSEHQTTAIIYVSLAGAVALLPLALWLATATQRLPLLG